MSGCSIAEGESGGHTSSERLGSEGGKEPRCLRMGEGMMIIILWSNLGDVGRSGTEREAKSQSWAKSQQK